ncbi:MAG: biotin--[acetyl-CoA-carboxylase] ligase [Gordonia sp. (in: high G+C Gram-positive bacteria)]
MTDDLSATDIRKRLAGTCWHTVEVVASTGSTNADLVARAGDPDLAGTVRITTDQTAGRGRHTRTWEAPPGGQVAISAVLPVTGRTDRLGWLSLGTGIAAARGIEAATGVAAVLKWPNDVLVGEKKVAGILSEFVDTPAGGVAVVGTGINTGMTPADLPVPTATSLAIETGTAVDVAAVAAGYLRALSALNWPDAVDAIAAAYRRHCDTLGRAVRLILPTGEVAGTAVDVDAEGRILVVDDAGHRHLAAAGDVVHLRRA